MNSETQSTIGGIKVIGVIGVIGLGAMGNGMAQSLRRAGHNVRVFDVREESVAAFVKDGGIACASTSDLAAQCDVVVSVVVNAEQTENVLFGDNGCAGALKPGSVFVMCSTVDPNWSVALETRLLRESNCPVWASRRTRSTRSRA